MSLSRLENLGAVPTGTIIHVSPDNFDATDSIENRGISPNRPFFSIQRAILEASLYSFQPGRNNDRNDRTTILVSPGTHYIDNRPGFSIQNISGSAVFKKRTGKDTWTTQTVEPFGDNTNFDIFDPNNDLYKYNSVYGGVILPRGTSIVAQDLRKTKIRPLYVPDPLDPDVERSSILNVTGSCYFSQFTFFDADTTKFAYKNYNDTKHVPKFSHHKLTAFVYADGVNKVRLGLEQTDLTDLEMYYYKVTRAYDSLSGRGLEDFPANLDFEPNVNEFRIVGPLQENPLGISSIRAGNGDGTGDNSIITVTTANLQSKIETPHNFAVDTPVIIRGVTQSPTAYNGSFTVREVVGVNTFTFVTPVIPSEVLPNTSSFDLATVSVESDTVSSASPYIFNCSLRSVYGMSGMWADGARADGFKSMVVAQFTGVSLQKDNSAYTIYDDGVYYDDITLPAASPLRPLYQNSRSIFKPEFENFHIRCSNDAFIQAVSVFAIGYAKHFVTESGADMSITNSNSNFGANALNSVGFRKLSFDRDDTGYITHIIPPKELVAEENDVSWLSLDINKIQTIANPKRLYIFSFDNKDIPPAFQVDGYRIGARENDKLYLTITGSESQTTYSAPIFMTTPGDSEGSISKKSYTVARTGVLNNITTNTITLTEAHRFFTGEKVRIFSDNAQAPEGLEIDKVYFAITAEVEPSLGTNEIRLAATLNDAISNQEISGFSNNGGILSVVSTVSDKEPGDAGHPIQWDEANNNWYINSSQFPALNEIYDVVVGINPSTFGRETPTTFFKRLQEDRPIDERLYKFRYVIPKEYINAKKPQVGYVLQESKNVAISTVSINEGATLLNSTELRNDKVIVSAVAGSIVNNTQIVTIATEVPHNFIVGDTVKIQSIRSTNNPTGVGIVSTFNGEYKVLTIPTSRTFTYQIEGVKVNPGTFTNNINQRATRQQRDALPLVSRQSYKNNFVVYRVDTIREHSPGVDGQDGIYHLLMLSSSVGISNRVGYGLSEKYFSQDIRNLYPQIDRDNPVSNPNATISYADLRVVGNVITDDKKKSITLEGVNQFNQNTRVGFGITGVVISGAGNTTLTIFTDVEHKLNSIKAISVVNSGAGYPVNTTIYSTNLIDTKFAEEDATCKYSTTSSGTVNSSSIRLIDVGAAHTVGERLGISGGAISNAIVEVTEINDNVGDVLELSGFYSTNLNGVYEIVDVPNKKQITLYNSSGISSYISNTTGVIPIGYIAAKGLDISSVVLGDLSLGIATVTTTYSHGLAVGNKFKFTKSNLEFYNNKDFVVSSVVGVTTFTFNVGVATTTATPSTGKILKYGISSNALNLGRGEENLASRACYLYSGLTVRLTSPITINSTTLNVDNSNGITRGDFLLINNEIVRVSTFPVGNSFNILRSQLGTIRTTASTNEAVKKIKVLPVETRRPSFMRASGHTFEYLGYGPGNYSTALPQRQDRILSDVEVLVSQAKRQEGGSIVYTGMNDLGEFYTGSTKVSATTGEETIVGAPILTYTGDDANGSIGDRQSGIFDEVLIRDRLTVEGGENNNQSSQFYGPVTFNKRVTNLSQEGLLLRNLFIRGSVSQEKLFTVGISTPTSSIIPTPINGDISFVSNPVNNYLGFVYKSNEWRQWGLISNEPNRLSFTVDKLGVGATPTDIYPLNVSGTAQIQNLRVTGGVLFTQPFNLGDVKFEDVDVFGTMTFLGINPDTGITTTYTQIHERGTSKLNQLEVVGVSTFTKDVYINQPDEFGTIPTLYADRLDLANIRVGIANSNTIDTKLGDLTLNSTSKRTIINTNLLVADGNVAITTTRSSGVATAFITNSTLIRLGVGNTTEASYIDFNNDSRVFNDYGLRLIRNSGIGSQSSSLIHRGNASLFINAVDNGGDVRILTNDTERLIVGTSGTVTLVQNNSGQNLGGTHLRLTQAGTGDVALSWDTTNNNVNRRWYAGIDTSDGYSWKLATPLTTVAYGDENFDIDTKIRVRTNGDLTLTSNVGVTTFITTYNGQNIISSNTGTFNLLNTNVTQVNAFGAANVVNLASNSASSTVNIRGITASTSTTTGALVVAGGVGIAGNLNVAGNLNATKIDGTFRVIGPNATTLEGPTDITSTLTVDGITTLEDTQDATSTTTGSLRVAGGVGIVKDLWVGGNLWNVDIEGYLRANSNTLITGITTISSNAPSSSTTTGALVVAGGMGIGGNLRVGGNLGATTIAGALTVNSPNTTTLGGPVNISGATGITSTLSVTGNTTISSNTPSTSTTTGALIVAGGVGIGGNLRVAGNLGATTIAGTLTVNGPNTTTLGGATNISGATGINSTLSVTGNTTISSDTQSNSTTTGALVVAGGVGIVRDLRVGGTIYGNISSNATITGTIENANNIQVTTSGDVGIFNVGLFAGTGLNPAIIDAGFTYNSSINSLTIPGATNIGGNLTVGGNLGITTIAGTLTVNGPNATTLGGPTNINSTLDISGITRITNATNSTATNNGALIVVGGVGVGGNLRVGGNLGVTTIAGSLTVEGSNTTTLGGATNINSTLDVSGITKITNGQQSTTTANGALVVTGGVGVGGNLRVGGNLGVTTIAGSLTVEGSNTTTLGGATNINSTLNVTGITTISSNAPSSSTTTGALVVAGGVGVGGNLNVAGTIFGNIVGNIAGVTSESNAVRINGAGNSGEFFVGLIPDNTSTYRTPAIDSGIKFNAGTNVLSVEGDIIAFASDDRLKTNIKQIENALDKVISLSGFTFNFNDTAKELGFNPEIKYVGVSAQEVEEVLPEAVAACPADDKYLTVKYEKLVPLLIEAIKDIKNELELLKEKVS